jgi:ubiquitin carboxyl-terminal hydrolase 6/32
VFSATVHRLDGSTPVKYGLRLNMDEKYKTLKQDLSSLSSIPADQLLLVEIQGPIVKVGLGRLNACVCVCVCVCVEI